MAMSKEKAHKLSVYLLKEDIVDGASVLKDNRGLNCINISLGEKSAPLYYKENHPSSPSWVSFFKPDEESELGKLKNKGTAAVLFVESKNRLFALTFGYGRLLLESGCLEENFGFRVVLNTVDPEEIRCADAQTSDAIPVLRRTQASTKTSMREMGINADQDLLYAVTGKPKNSALGTQITGKDALRISVAVSVGTLPKLLGILLDAFSAEDYKNDFWWVDNLSEIRDPTLRSKLDVSLERKISERDLSRTWLAIPEVIDWEDFGGFKYHHAKRGKLNEDINWQDYLGFVGSGKSVTADMFHKHHILHIGESSGQALHSWPVYQCIYCEIEIDKQSYVLSNGKWYRIKDDFVANLNESIRLIPQATSLLLPEYKDANEEAYNKRVSSENSTIALMDRGNVRHGGGRSQIEFCDLYTLDKRLIHVKRYGGSSVLSHLFSQGLASADLLLMDGEFREKVNEKLPQTHQLPETKPNSSDYEVIYAIISKDLKELKDLPLFSKITLKNSYRSLSSMGFRASFFVISIVVNAENYFPDDASVTG
jgi:uncharacterized protein (TIGR04141 family)